MIDPRNWPEVNLVPLPSGGLFRGIIARQTIPAPAAGTDWTKTLAGGSWWQLLALRATLTSSAAVANRAVRLALGDGSATFLRLPAGAVQAAGLAVTYNLVAGAITPVSTPVAGETLGQLPPLLLPPGFTISAVTGLIDAADQWSAVELLLAQVDMGPRGEPIGLVHLPPQLATVGV